MYCRFCGKNIDDRSAFCSACGKPTGPAAPVKPLSAIAAPSLAQVGVILCYVLGALFLLGGILPYLLAGDSAEYNQSAALLANSLGTTYIVANDTLSCFIGSYASLFYFASSFLTFFAGLLLLKRSTTAKNALLLCIISHVLSLACSGIVFGLVYITPATIISWYTPEASVIDAGLDLLANYPLFLSYYREVAICRAIFSVVLIALSVAFLLVSKPQSRDIFKPTVKIPTAGITSMVVVLSILALVVPLLQNYLIGMFGTTALGGLSAANNYFYPVTTACLYTVFLALGICVLLNRANRWIITLPVVGLMVIIGTALLMLTSLYLRNQGIPIDIYPIAVPLCKGMVIGRTAMMIAIFLWFGAVAKDQMPTWLQIILPPVLLIPYGIVGIFGFVLLKNLFLLPLCSLSLAFPLAAVSLLARRKKALPAAEVNELQ